MGRLSLKGRCRPDEMLGLMQPFVGFGELCLSITVQSFRETLVIVSIDVRLQGREHFIELIPT